MAERSLQANIGKVITATAETEFAVTISFADGSTSVFPKGPLQDLRLAVAGLEARWLGHVLQTIPPAHRGFSIVEFAEGTGD